MPLTIQPSAAAMSADSILKTISETGEIESVSYTMNGDYGTLYNEMVKNSASYTTKYIEDQASTSRSNAYGAIAGALVQGAGEAVSFGVGYSFNNAGDAEMSTLNSPSSPAQMEATFSKDIELQETASVKGTVSDVIPLEDPANPSARLVGSVSGPDGEPDSTETLSEMDKKATIAKAEALYNHGASLAKNISGLGSTFGSLGSQTGTLIGANATARQAQNQGLAGMYQAEETVMKGIQDAANTSISNNEQAKAAAVQLDQAIIAASAGFRG